MHLKNQSRLTAAGLMLALVSNRLLNVLAPDDIVWQAHDISLSACFVLASLLALQCAPYSMLLVKCVSAVVFGAALTDFMAVATGAHGYWYVLAVQAVISAALGCFYCIRSYEQPSDDLRADGHVYCLRTRPDSLQGLLVAMLGVYGPNGGYALWIDGKLYRYRRGALVKQSAGTLPVDRYQITRGGPTSPELLRELDFITGSRWTWRHNCLTVIGPIWRRYCA